MILDGSHVRRLVLMFIGLALVFIIVALAVERFVFNDRHFNQRVSIADRGCRSDRNPVFRGAFTDLSKVWFITPLGSTQTESVGASSIVLKAGENAPVYNPTDAVLEKITYAQRSGFDQPGEYSLHFRASCEVTYVFGRLDSLSDRVKALAPDKPASAAGAETRPNLILKQGELLGYAASRPSDDSFDFYLFNESQPAPHLNPARWTSATRLAQCPYDYFETRNDNNLKRYYFGKMITHNENVTPKVFDPNTAMKSAQCGSVAADSADTISGGWFMGDSTDSRSAYLSISKYLSAVEITRRRDGETQEVFTDYSPAILPADVRIGQSTCYQDRKQNRWVFARLESANQMAFAHGQGSCPANFPSTGSQLWSR